MWMFSISVALKANGRLFTGGAQCVYEASSREEPT